MKYKRKKTKDISKINFALKELAGKTGQAGWFKGNEYKAGLPVAYIAAIMEFGYEALKIPPRSYMRTTIRAKQTYWSQLAKQLAQEVLDGTKTATQAMDTLGLVAAGDMREKISNITSPKLKDATVAARLRQMRDGKTIGNLTKPLIATTRLYETLINIVADK